MVELNFKDKSKYEDAPIRNKNSIAMIFVIFI